MNTMNDYSKISAENASSRMATVSGEEAFMSDTESPTGILKWGHRQYIDSKHFAYGDVNIYVVPVVGDIDKDKISRAINKKFPRQTSFGKLRWRAGWSVLLDDELGFKKTDKKNTVTIEEHFGLAD